MELHILLHKIRYHKTKMLLALKKNMVIYRLFPKRLFFCSLVLACLCLLLSQKMPYEFLSPLYETIKNVCCSFVAGYIFYFVSDLYPKTKRKLDEMGCIINNELCILRYAKILTDTTVKFSTSTYLGEDSCKIFIVNCAKSDPYKNDRNLVELNDSFLNRLHFVHNEPQIRNCRG